MNSNVVVITIRGPISRRRFGGISTDLDQCIFKEGYVSVFAVLYI